MAEIQELDVDSSVGELEAVEEQIEAEAAEKPVVPDALELPDKYRNKTISDVVRMHQEAEKLIDRHANEVGEIRKLADELIKAQLKPKVEKEPVPEVDFFENPQAAIQQVIANDPRIASAEQYMVQLRQQQALNDTARKHPDFMDIVKTTDFQQWVQSSKIRQRLFQEAENYDADAADELLTTYKELRTVQQKRQVDEVEKQARDKALRSAAVDTGSSVEGSRKIYRRADLIRLKINNPSKYDAMQDEIMQAYADGRVR